ncbi:MAG: carbon-nitrogen hydrolase family protein [Alphaproteobacteria bacterium]
MTTPLTIACVQLSTGSEPEKNLTEIISLIHAAHERGADLIALPEVLDMIEPNRAAAFAKAQPEETHLILQELRRLAVKINRWILAGSIVVKLGPEKLANRSLLIDNRGAIVARYDKIHMFDVDLPDQPIYRESAAYQPGDKAVIAATPWFTLGMSVCYDVRFGYLYRALAKAGAEVLSIPAAFTKFTGAAHWHILVRTRAIETGCFVVAPAQCGNNAPGRQTFGHSLIVSPWGEILAEAGQEPSVITAQLDLGQIAQARSMVPALSHDRSFTLANKQGNP